MDQRPDAGGWPEVPGQKRSFEEAPPKFEPQPDPDHAGALGIHNDELGAITFDGRDGHPGIVYKNLPIPVLRDEPIHVVHSAAEVASFADNVAMS